MSCALYEEVESLPLRRGKERVCFFFIFGAFNESGMCVWMCVLGGCLGEERWKMRK